MKNNLKKFLILGLLCSVALITTGCQKNDDNNQNDDLSNTNNQTENVSNQDNEGITRGEWTDSTYSNSFLNVKFNMPEGYEKASDEQIAELMNIGTEMLNDDQQKLAELSEQNGLYCMLVSDPSTNANAIVLIEKTPLKVTSEYYLSSVKNQLEAVDSIDYTISDSYESKVGSNNYLALDATASVSGQSIKQTYFTRAVKDNYMASIIITTTDDTQLQNFLNCFE